MKYLKPCPHCGGNLTQEIGGLLCVECGATYTNKGEPTALEEYPMDQKLEEEVGNNDI